jgi:PadR family transcriptional regulator PadR
LPWTRKAAQTPTAVFNLFFLRVFLRFLVSSAARWIFLLTIVDDRGIVVDSRGVFMPKPSDLLQGTLDLLILKIIAREPLHGWGIAKRIQILSGDVLAVGQGSLYPALHRLEQQGWITAEWKDSELGRSAKFYLLTSEGRKQLERELKSWDRLSSAVQLLIANA